MSTVEHRQLDRTSPMPLWAQLEAELRRRLERGEFADRFPTDLELTETYGVSRHTARHAVSELNRHGLLRRERGIGTTINSAEFEQSLGSLYSLFQAVEAAGVEQRSEVLALGQVTDARAATELGLDPSSDLVNLARVRYAGESPLAIDRVWLPADVGAGLLGVDFRHTGLYDELERVGGIRPTSGWERIAPALPSAEERTLLGLRRTDAVFEIERLGSLAGRAIEWRVTAIRGDRFRFVAEWSAGSRGDMRLTTVD